ncbi:MAG TPA: metallophosphoesterase [Candidatus Nanoarchaeia archaeon]|nr:metallophosphoesterase [Candidatus Nanoarchaeia archaeon]
MKILAFGDIHGDTAMAKKLADQAERENVDLVVVCGDITYHERSLENIIGPFAKKNKRVVLIPGNHESLATADFLAELYGATNLHGYSIKHKDVGLFGCGLANIGPHMISEEEIFNVLKKSYQGLKGMHKKILVSHVHPSDTKMEKFSEFVPGSTGLRKAIDTFKPDLVICAHVHEAGGVEENIGKTRVINVAKQGKIIEI